ncbi:30S ribosomal protein S8 [Candidatus Daviesbacteria bacterium RIFCSPLOWO2_02_FULL_40_8]|uniref:Small ribosomal subunit protein uS8 n=1 Tax=Candidatus Daviesbacteria bacterium RIFCSPLOWO2_01_FULL_40_24 TaxID=1797787 RepID=A0A1F5MJV6_9BACT|nr:MAG: 30S ribosomal protein S8 [Candidatus Daviesbacteria bacterium RIFCSPHIGHO2_01_FULL_41_45]OGE35392.1 MAG: 30S ribosomal protein S8 [Candidatus Daviesbacteria bacterium RIFCSPHIGHO2_02_FULL_41_14]OGE65635.1 MAG: 30S ribosomal protein S8 [Candidatus Daviesbacteria bacterium RIFCSPLOWO2_01_FULL_40_24]OGE66314.1 MAG: 30S ribosomal protein S8 [Candidatus Daviesbacteria bacterium RIFCSPLOWO2_02_FULL_40_8]
MDKVGDLLIRIKNGYMASRIEVMVLSSNLSRAILEVLQKEGYINSFKTVDREIQVSLKYLERGPALTDVKRISKPGRRIYKSKELLPRVLDGMGVAIISTPKGVMTDKQARKEGVGGEVMAYVW